MDSIMVDVGKKKKMLLQLYFKYILVKMLNLFWQVKVILFQYYGEQVGELMDLKLKNHSI